MIHCNLLLLLSSLCILCAPIQCANLFISKDGSDTNNNNCQQAEFPCSTIKHALEMSARADIINIASGRYIIDEPVVVDVNDITLRKWIEKDDVVQLVCGPAVNRPMFSISDQTESVLFTDIDFLNCLHAAVAIGSNSSSAFQHCSFINNTNQQGFGGAVYCSGIGIDVNFESCLFQDNFLIASDSSVSIAGSAVSFVHMSEATTPSIQSVIQIRQSIFVNNFIKFEEMSPRVENVQGKGAALNIQHSMPILLYIEGCSFESNQIVTQFDIDVSGAAINIDTKDINQLSYCNFTCVATDFVHNHLMSSGQSAGGAIFASVASFDFDIDNCLFLNNTISQSSSVLPTGEVYGGAISVVQEAIASEHPLSIRVSGANLKKNHVISSASIARPANVFGGAVYLRSVSNKGEIEFEDCYFEQNRASGGDALSFNDGGDAFGGALCIDTDISTLLSFLNCSFVYNSVQSGGSDMANSGQRLGGSVALFSAGSNEHRDTNWRFISCDFQNNVVAVASKSAGNRASVLNGGGAIATIAPIARSVGALLPLLMLEDCTFVQNSAVGAHQRDGYSTDGGASCGGAILSMGDCQVFNSSFESNYVFGGNGSLVVTERVFRGGAGGSASGGALYVLGQLTAHFSHFLSNRVVSGGCASGSSSGLAVGGAISGSLTDIFDDVDSFSTLTIDQCVFEGNVASSSLLCPTQQYDYATAAGAAIAGRNLFIVDSMFLSNRFGVLKKYGMGTVYAGESVLLGCHFEDNGLELPDEDDELLGEDVAYLEGAGVTIFLDNVTIQDCEFVSNRASRGAAVSVSYIGDPQTFDPSLIVVNDTVFISNQAVGGTIFFFSFRLFESHAHQLLVELCNSKWNRFEQNEAVYGCICAAYPKQLMNPFKYISVWPGLPFNISYQLIDSFNNSVWSSDTITVQSPKNASLSVGQTTRHFMSDIEFDEHREYLIEIRSFGGFHTEFKLFTFYANDEFLNNSVSVKVSNCPPGFHFSNNDFSQCVACPRNYYSLSGEIDSTEESQCLPCPDLYPCLYGDISLIALDYTSESNKVAHFYVEEGYQPSPPFAQPPVKGTSRKLRSCSVCPQLFCTVYASNSLEGLSNGVEDFSIDCSPCEGYTSWDGLCCPKGSTDRLCSRCLCDVYEDCFVLSPGFSDRCEKCPEVELWVAICVTLSLLITTWAVIFLPWTIGSVIALLFGPLMFSIITSAGSWWFGDIVCYLLLTVVSFMLQRVFALPTKSNAFVGVSGLSKIALFYIQTSLLANRGVLDLFGESNGTSPSWLTRKSAFVNLNVFGIPCSSIHVPNLFGEHLGRLLFTLSLPALAWLLWSLCFLLRHSIKNRNRRDRTELVPSVLLERESQIYRNPQKGEEGDTPERTSQSTNVSASTPLLSPVKKKISFQLPVSYTPLTIDDASPVQTSYALAVSIFSFAYFPLTNIAMKSLNCENVEEFGSYFVTKMPWIQCSIHDSDFIPLLILSVFVVVVITFSIPLYVCHYLFTLHQQSLFTEPSNVFIFGSLFVPYRADCWWFELLFTLRKLSIAVALSLLLPSPSQNQIVIVILILSLVVQAQISPFVHKLESLLDSLSLTVLSVTFAGLSITHQSFSKDITDWEHLWPSATANGVLMFTFVIAALPIIYNLSQQTWNALRQNVSKILCQIIPSSK